ncbi:uncharacterized protein [Euphorbia lathyris]|uniref:uncharacterized protein n=1 Tax=Euphorbia lathyris TaxID=212925 RepID=UPI003313660E
MAYYSYINPSIDYNQGEFNRDYNYYSSNSNYSHYNYPVPIEHSVTNNSNNSQIFTYDPVIPSTISYSISSPTDPKCIQYDPPEFTVSYSVSEFTETDVFEEYDPTPYGGGYNLTFTYGNPLPPSDDICYPRSASSAAADSSPPALPSIAVPSAPIVTPNAKIEATERKHDVVEEEEEEEEEEASKPTVSGGGNDGEGAGGGGDSWSNFGGGSGGGEVSYGYEKQVSEMPYGYGLEAMDICEGLLGYWPCLSRCRRRLNDCQQAADCENCRDPCADYLFGNPNPYAQTMADQNSYGQSFWGYQ